jgi:hypothetical protein
MTSIRITGKPLRKPGTSEEEMDKWIAVLAAIPDPAKRCRALQEYVHLLLRPEPKSRGRLARADTRRAQILADWDVFEAVEDMFISGRVVLRRDGSKGTPSIAEACDQLAEDRGEDGSGAGNVLRKAYYRHTHTAFYPASSRLKKQRAGKNGPQAGKPAGRGIA